MSEIKINEDKDTCQLSLEQYLNSICNWCDKHFINKPVFINTSAFCSKKCVDEFDAFVKDLLGLDEPLPRIPLSSQSKK